MDVGYEGAPAAFLKKRREFEGEKDKKKKRKRMK